MTRSQKPGWWNAWLLAVLLLNTSESWLRLEAQTNLNLPVFDFTKPEDASGWLPTHHISSLQTSPTGLVVSISGSDPYFTGPTRDYPPGVPLWARLKLYSEQAGSAQLFYFSTSASEANSVRASFPAQAWTQARVPIPALGPGYRLRIDPPGTAGKAVVASLSFEQRSLYPDFDFATVPDALEWSAAHDIASLTPTTDGLAVAISGSDPYMFGPARDYPADKLLWLHLRLTSSAGGIAQVFYFTTGPSEENSVKFFVPAQQAYDVTVPIPALGDDWRIRIDPPGSSGTCVLHRMWFEERVLLKSPTWPTPKQPTIGTDALAVTSGELTLTHDRSALGAFEVKVAGKPIAVGNTKPLAGYLTGNALHWLDYSSNVTQFSVATNSQGLHVVCRAVGGDGTTWNLEQDFAPGVTNSINVETRLSVNQDQTVAYFPAFMLLPGLGSFGTNKNQGLFCGLEYLDNEPSSSEADITGPESKRQVPDSLKITIPLMAVAAQDRYVGLAWEPAPDISAVFDSPDRLFGSSGHVMGLLLPGSNGENRREGDLLPYRGRPLRANDTFVVRATIIGGKGASIVPALQQYVALRGLPALPTPVQTADQYFALAAHGWLDSQIRTNALFKHAYWPGFTAQPAADAAVWMRWLEEKIADVGLQSRLSNTAAAAIAEVTASRYNDSHVGHIAYPLASLLYNAVPANALTAQSNAKGLISRFQPDGSILYEPSAGGLDYGKTHFAKDANGLTATYVLSLLENAVFAGDRSLVSTGLVYLDALGKFQNTVPRGAQTWEVPLHTPDILASAKLLRCYTLGYELTGDPDYLDQARYWAWTGIPFVYIIPPTSGNVGIYGTIPVFGATAWIGSWFGVPVQWCGLVYADALYRFAKYDPGMPWKQIADGIALSGVQQSWNEQDTERQGLLPDSYVLRPQVRGGPPINPASVQAAAVVAYGAPRPYDFHAFPWHGIQVHAAGELGSIVEDQERVAFTVTNWSSAPCSLYINGLSNTPGLRLNGQDIPLGPPHVFQAPTGRLVLRVQGTVRVELMIRAQPKLQIRRSTTNAAVDIFWPAAAANYVLESSEIVGPEATWQPSTGALAKTGETLVATEILEQPTAFFRLRLSQ